MTYTVTWRLGAIQQLNLAFGAASNPEAVREAAARIDYALRRYPRDMGESREPGFRLWYEDVLGVYYRVDEDALRVEILFAGPASRHRMKLTPPCTAR